MSAVTVDQPAEGIARVTLDRPPVNALDAAAYADLDAAFGALAEDRAVRVVVLTAAGRRVFSAGTDLAAFATAEATAAVTRAAFGFFTRLAQTPQPVIGALNGPAIGAGAMAAAECDLLLATRRHWFATPEVTVGFPGGGSHVKRLAPHFKARRMILLGERLTAEEALAHGTLAEVVEDADDLPACALAWAQRLAALEPRAVGEARRIMRQPETDAALEGYRVELEALAAVLAERRAAGGG